MDSDSDSDKSFGWADLALRNHCPLLPPGKADLIPVEILSEIFLLIVQYWSGYRECLMLVCRRWHAIMLSTPGIHSQLTIRRSTQKEVVQAFIQGRKSRLDVRVDMNDEMDDSDFNPENFFACFMTAAQASSRWSSLNLISPPPHGEYKALQTLQPLERLETFKVGHGLGKFVEPLMTAISRSASPNLTIMGLADSIAVHYLVQPACLHVNHFLTTLKIHLSKRVDSPVDILPHLHRLETFEARNLCLPSYPTDAPLPLTYTLRSLNLRSVSVQWMVGHVFPALEKCTIRFPHHVDINQALQPVTMPSCSRLRYHSNDLQPFAQFRLPHLVKLDVKSGQWNVWRGNPQLVALCPVVATGAKSLTSLRLDVECSEKLLLYMLSLIPALRFLDLLVARPNALSTTFFQAFIVRKPDADGTSDLVGPPSQAIAPLCPSLEILRLHYRRWLRGPDKNALIVALGNIISERRDILLELSFDGPPFDETWSIDESMRKPHNDIVLKGVDIILGIATPHGVIPMSRNLRTGGLVSLPVKEADYLRLRGSGRFEFLFTHDHMELMTVDDYDRPPLPTSLPCVLPLFSALRVLVVERVNPSFLAGHTFPKLERCRVVKSSDRYGASPSFVTDTGMPVCTRVGIDSPYLLATFKLPQIYELALDYFPLDGSTLWEDQIAVNANLSGLNLLHMKDWPLNGDLVPILRLLPSLETFIISSQLGVVPFRAFLPMGAYRTSGLKQPSGEGQRLPLLCPKLQCVQIEGQDPSVDPEVIPILKDIVTLRAECGSPLKEFTFSTYRCTVTRESSESKFVPGRRFELIGKNGGFTMERINRWVAKKFHLDI